MQVHEETITDHNRLCIPLWHRTFMMVQIFQPYLGYRSQGSLIPLASELCDSIAPSIVESLGPFPTVADMNKEKN